MSGTTAVDNGIYYIRLFSGEQLIAKVVRVEDDPHVGKVLVIENPAMMGMGQGEGGSVQLMLGEFMPFLEKRAGKKHVPIRVEYIAFKAKADEQITNTYNQRFGSGLVTKTAPGLILPN